MTSSPTLKLGVAFGLGVVCAVAAVYTTERVYGTSAKEPAASRIAESNLSRVKKQDADSPDPIRTPVLPSNAPPPPISQSLNADQPSASPDPTNTRGADTPNRASDRSTKRLFDKELPDAKSMAADSRYNTNNLQLSEDDTRSLQHIIDELNQGRSDIVTSESDLTSQYFQDKLARGDFKSYPKDANTQLQQPSGTRIMVQNSESSPNQTVVEIRQGEFPDLDALTTARKKLVEDARTRISDFFTSKQASHPANH